MAPSARAASCRPAKRSPPTPKLADLFNAAANVASVEPFSCLPALLDWLSVAVVDSGVRPGHSLDGTNPWKAMAGFPFSTSTPSKGMDVRGRYQPKTRSRPRPAGGQWHLVRRPRLEDRVRACFRCQDLPSARKTVPARSDPDPAACSACLTIGKAVLRHHSVIGPITDETHYSFLGTNIAVLVVIAVIVKLLGLDRSQMPTG